MSKKVIMTVDDEVDVRDTLKTLLEYEGYKVISAVDGKDCLKKLKKETPDVILLDIIMPGMTTKEILERIKKIKSAKLTKIIFLTAVYMSNTEISALLSHKNVVAFIQKPFKNDFLLKKIKNVLKL